VGHSYFLHPSKSYRPHKKSCIKYLKLRLKHRDGNPNVYKAYKRFESPVKPHSRIP